MSLKLNQITLLTIAILAILLAAIPVHAQYNNYGGGYNQYGYGGNNYNSYGGGYGGSYGGVGRNNRFGNSSYGGGYNSSYGGGYGNSSYGGGYNSYGGYGNSMGGLGSRSARSGRSGRSSGSGYNQYNSAYGQSGNSYNSSGGSSSSRRGRSSRSGGNYGGNYGNSAYGNQVPNTAASEGGQPRQTSSTGQSSERRNALGGKSGARAALPSAAAGGDAGAVQIQGAAAGPQGGTPAKGAPGKGGASGKDAVKTKPVAMLFLDTPNQVAIVNQPKLISVVLTTNNVEYDTLTFALQYDPDDLEPISGQDAAGNWSPAEAIPVVSPKKVANPSPEGNSEADSEGTFITNTPDRYEIVKNTIDPKKGVIEFSVKVKNGGSKEGGEVINLNFLPLREVQTTISFLFTDPQTEKGEKAALTSLTLANNDQLGSRFSPTDGVINLDLQIYETLEKSRSPMKVKKAGGEDADEGEDKDSYETKLSLVPRQSTINVGDTVDVDVVVANPNKEVFDTVDLLIAYNPRIFEALDGDDFSSGVNIADQEYKERFAFDFPFLNTIDVEKGIIDYRKKSMRKPVREQGVLATIHLRAIRPTTKTTFRMFINETGEEPTTGLFYKNKDRVGSPTDAYDGVNTCSLEVRPTTAYMKQFK